MSRSLHGGYGSRTSSIKLRDLKEVPLQGARTSLPTFQDLEDCSRKCSALSGSGSWSVRFGCTFLNTSSQMPMDLVAALVDRIRCGGDSLPEGSRGLLHL